MPVFCNINIFITYYVASDNPLLRNGIFHMVHCIQFNVAMWLQRNNVTLFCNFTSIYHSVIPMVISSSFSLDCVAFPHQMQCAQLVNRLVVNADIAHRWTRRWWWLCAGILYTWRIMEVNARKSLFKCFESVLFVMSCFIYCFLLYRILQYLFFFGGTRPLVNRDTQSQYHYYYSHFIIIIIWFIWDSFYSLTGHDSFFFCFFRVSVFVYIFYDTYSWINHKKNKQTFLWRFRKVEVNAAAAADAEKW